MLFDKFSELRPAIAFIQATMTAEVDRRPLVGDLSAHAWIENSRAELEDLYATVVIQGKNWKAR